MPTISTPIRRFAASLVLLAFAGCNDPTKVEDTLPRKAVTGSVTLDGQPLSQGVIQFDPAQDNPPPVTVAVAEIKDGKYVIERGLGPVPGNYKVSISSRPPVIIGPGQEPGARPKQDPEKVPAKYNINSTLTKEISSDAVQIIEFDLKSS